VGRWFSAGDSAFALIDGNPATAADDDWRTVRVTAVDTTVTCATGASRAQLLTLDGLAGTDRVLPGAPLRTFDQYTYGAITYSGATFLGRGDPSGTIQPIVGPLSANAAAPVRFAYLDENATATADPLAVSQIEVTLQTRADVLDAQGDWIQDSLSVRINVRN
jgi:hypothetical protein